MAELDKPLYQKLKDYIIDTIKSEELKPGDRIWSENQLAKKFDCSRHTVRQALGELASEGWLYKAQGKGTFVDRRPDQKSESTRTIGVVTTYLNDYIFPAIIQGIDEILSGEEYNILLGCTYNQHEKERTCLQNLKNSSIDGLIVEATKSALLNPNLDVYREISSKGIPVLFIHGCYKELDYSYVVEDDVQAGYLATQHLIHLGHTNIGGIFKKDDIQGHYRFAGFQKAKQDNKISLLNEEILWFDTDNLDHNLRMGGNNEFEHIITNSSALVCYNDEIALRVMDAMRERGIRIPDDISLVSFDDSQLAVASEVKLTTVAHPQQELGRVAAQAMINMITRKKNYYNIKMQPELIIRGSTKKYY